jgi:hypothetical protein
LSLFVRNGLVGEFDNDNNTDKNSSNNNDDNSNEKVTNISNNHLNINPNLHIYEPKKYARIEKKKSKAKLEKNQSRHNVHISRQSLRKLLIKDINDENIIWNKHFKNYIEYNDHVMIYFHDDTSVKCSLLVAADGIYSTIRKQLIPQPLTAVNLQAIQNLVYYMCEYIYIYICMHIYVFCMYICLYVYICVYIYQYAYDVYIYMYIYIYIYIYICA